MGLSSRKPEGGIRFWLDPNKRDPTTPVPPWEGVYNGTPNYMDITLYCMMSLDKQKIKDAVRMHGHLDFIEVLRLLKVHPESMTPCLPFNELRKDKIFFVSSSELGYIVGYTKFDEIDTYRPPEDQQKYNAVMVRFEDLQRENILLPSSFRPVRPAYKILTMYDQNFILAKECEMLSMEELYAYITKPVKSVNETVSGDLLDAPEQSGVLKM